MTLHYLERYNTVYYTHLTGITVSFTPYTYTCVSFEQEFMSYTNEIVALKLIFDMK